MTSPPSLPRVIPNHADNPEADQTGTPSGRISKGLKSYGGTAPRSYGTGVPKSFGNQVTPNSYMIPPIPFSPRSQSNSATIGPGPASTGASALTSALLSSSAVAQSPGPSQTTGPFLDLESAPPDDVGSYAGSQLMKMYLVGDDDDDDSVDARGRLLSKPGGDVVRGIISSADQQEFARKPRTRSESLRHNTEQWQVSDIRKPGGLRRDYIRTQNERESSLSPAMSGSVEPMSATVENGVRALPLPIHTQDFFEFFLHSYRFAGENFSEDDDEDEDEDGDEVEVQEDGEDGPRTIEGDDEEGHYPSTERSSLLPRNRRSGLATSNLPTRRPLRRTRTGPRRKISSSEAALMLLKSFVGTGVLFLPRAFMNGGLLFSSVTLVVVAIVSLFCFILLLDTQLALGGDNSFGGMGEKAYNVKFRRLINLSLTVSQIGFSSAYIVFTSENLQSIVMVLSGGKLDWSIASFIAIQMLVLCPFAMLRQLKSLQRLTVFANAFIGIALVCLYYYDIRSLHENGPGPDIQMFNHRDWSLFVGTAIFTFEGIGLIIPIQQDMQHPGQLPKVLTMVMIGITALFTFSGAISYYAYGSNTKTVVLLNLPQNERLVIGMQILYSIAILFSTPLQFFPAANLTCSAIFSAAWSGKNNVWIKLLKNFVRCSVVVVCALIAWVGASNLDRFVSLVGSFACIPLVYIYPPLLHYKTAARTKTQKGLDIGMALVGLFMMVYTTMLTLMSWNGAREAHDDSGRW